MSQVPGQPDPVAEAINVFGHTVRMALIHELRTGGKRRSELHGTIRVSDPILQRHLEILREAGVIENKHVAPERGRPFIYTLNTERVDVLFNALHAYAYTQEQS